jgi:predicted TIM-barrel enzyme
MYPKVVGYMSVVNPIITIYSNETMTNFANDYTVGFPVGVNILKNDKIGFSFEITPLLKPQVTIVM